MAYRNTDGSVNWNIVAREIADIPGGIAVLRILQGNGIERLSYGHNREVGIGHTSVEHLISMVHEAKR